MKTTLDLPEELMREIKIRAIQENRKLENAIAHLLSRGLAQTSAEPGSVRHRVQLPLVECAHEAPPGGETTPEHVADVLLEDDSGAHRGSLR